VHGTRDLLRTVSVLARAILGSATALRDKDKDTDKVREVWLSVHGWEAVAWLFKLEVPASRTRFPWQAKGNLFLGRQNSEHISVALPECTLRYMYVPPCLLNFCIRVDRWLHSVPVSTCRERKYPKLPEDNRPLFAQGKVQVIFQLGILNVQWARVKKSVKFLADYREEWSGVEWSSTAEWSSRPRYVNGKAYVNHNVRCALQQLALESDADEKYAAGILAEVQKWPAIHVEEYV